MTVSRLVFAFVVFVILGGKSSSAADVSTVPVGNPGNAGELSGGLSYGADIIPARICGAVPYSYRIGTYEVTAAQFADFLNAAAKTDSHGLYNQNMDVNVNPLGCNIVRSGSEGAWQYDVAPGWADRPVNFVSFWDSLRYANWLNNGRGSSTTETGAYTLNGYTGSDGHTIQRNVAANWFVPSEDESHKGGYHKNDGVTGNYWKYPTQSDTPPSNVLDSSGSNNANFYDGGYTLGSPYYRTTVGEFADSPSPYGTFDQGGNVCEWNDTVVLDSWQSGSARGLRGGGFNDGYPGHNGEHLSALYRNCALTTLEEASIGFRVATYDIINSKATGDWNSPLTWDHGTEIPSESRFASVTNSAVVVNTNANVYRLLVNNGGRVVLANSSVLTVTELLQIEQGGVLAGNGLVVTGAGVNNLGEIRVEKNQNTVLSSGVGTANTNAGRIQVIQGGVEFDQSLTNLPAGRIEARDSILRFDAGLTNQGALNVSFGTTDVFGSIYNFATGKITLSGNSNVTFWDNVTNDGTIKISAGSTAVIFGTLTGSGTTGTGTVFLEGGTGSLAAASLVLTGNDGGVNDAPVNIVNDSAAGLVVSGVQMFGTIEGSGNTAVVGNGMLSAMSISQGSLQIGGASTVTAVPEPSALALLSAASMALLYWRRRR
jgi:formylglycine-generating enzyme required for sulfatase activity